jgi:hypothetical protein
MSNAESFEIHFAGENGRWNLTEVMYDAEAAIAHARQIAAEPGIAAVRVVSSRFDPALDGFAERTIYTRAAAEVGAPDPTPGGDADLGCRRGADLYSRAARRAIQHVLAAELERRHITVLELLHDHAHARSVLDTGTVAQAAVQRYAIEAAQPGSPAVTTRIKRLYAVIEEAAQELRGFSRRPNRPELADGGLGRLAGEWSAQPEGRLILFASLAGYLRPAKDWGEKLALLTRALPRAPAAAELRLVDAIAEEVLGARGGLAAFIGPEERGGSAAVALLTVVMGGGVDRLTPAAAALLAAAGGVDALPGLRAAMAKRARRIIDMAGSLGDGTVVDEFRWLHKAAQVIREATPDSPASYLPPALERRAERYARAERLGQLLGKMREPATQVEQLIALEPLVFGKAARRMVGQYLRGILTDKSAPPGLDHRADANPGAQLRRFTLWQRKLGACNLPLRDMLVALVDEQAVRVLRERNVLRSVAGRFPEPWRQVLALMDLAMTEHFTEGEATRMAQDFIRQRLSDPAALGELQRAMHTDPQVAAKARAMHDFLARTDPRPRPPASLQTLVVAK